MTDSSTPTPHDPSTDRALAALDAQDEGATATLDSQADAAAMTSAARDVQADRAATSGVSQVDGRVEPSTATRLSRETTTALDRIALDAQRSGRVPGLAAGVARRGTLLWHNGFGAAHLGQNVGAERVGQTAPDENTRFQIASNTKTFVAVTIMALRDEGKLDIDAPARDIIDTITADSPLARMTPRQFMSHSSGIQREAVGDVFDTLVMPGRDEFLASLAHSERVLPAHTRFHYSNLGYALLGEMINRLDGGDWFASVQRRLLDPLGMTSTTLGYPGGVDTDPHAAGTYFVPPYSDVPVDEPVFDSRAIAPAAGMVSSVRDMARWGGFVANPDPAILSADTLEEMCQPQIVADVDRWGAAWGLGFMLLRRDDRIWVGHTGGWPGAITGVFTHRESATTGVALMNATHTPDPAALATDLASAVEECEPELPAAWTPGITVPPELVPLLGVWFSEGTQFTFVVEGGTLKARVEGLPEWKAPAVFERVDEDRYRTVAGRERGEWLVITRDADGSVTQLNWATYRFTREPAAFGEWL